MEPGPTRTQSRRAGARCWLLALLLSLLPFCSTASADTISEKRERAVQRARAGDVPQALDMLRAMLAAKEEDGLVAMDLATLLQQNGKAGEAVEVFEKAAKADPPDYALIAATRVVVATEVAIGPPGPAAFPPRFGLAAASVPRAER